jgi:16S rRNA (cytidine1402-2'-O)-methyltransferase
MPAISDPGADLASLAASNGIEVSVIPGPSAVTAALSISGLDTRYFHFEGFLPSERSKRRARLKALSSIGETIVLYEAPHRLRKLLDELTEEGFGVNKIAVCRELTKKYEEVLRMTVDECRAYYDDNEPRGEFCICLEPKPVGEVKTSGDPAQLIALLKDKGMSSKDIASVVSEYTGMNKKEAYKIASEG